MDQGYPNNDYDAWLDTQGNPMPWISQAVYSPGDIIQIDTYLTAHHKGYLEVKACPFGRGSTQQCFDSHPLMFVKDLLYDMPKDEAFPNRGYLHGLEQRLSMQFRLPLNLAGEQVLLQWVYWTANSCNPEGLAEYYSTPKPIGATGPNWNNLLDSCPPESETPLAPLPNPNSAVMAPERFINCAEVTILGNPSPSPPFPAPTLTPTFPPVEESPVQSPGTCGNGQTGNGICPNPSMCCSRWGYCGTAATGHCDDETPIAEPTEAPVLAPSPQVPPTEHNDSSPRMIAYLGNWQSCPTPEQLAQYSHIVVAFAVSYTWSPGKNLCSETCQITDPLVCENSARPDLIQTWKSMGKKVILSFGGAGMGGSWAGDPNNCWDYCFGREAQVVDRLTDIVDTMGFDGIDIDYEYFYEDNQNGSAFSKGGQARAFLKKITLGLRSSLPSGAELTHAPMEPDMVPGSAYFELLKEISSSLDFLMPQYYNGIVRSHADFPGALDHFSTLTSELFAGDVSKVVYGFCINACGLFNLDGYESSEVLEWLSKTYPCHGGAFFWVANDDPNGSWSSVVNEQLTLDHDNLCSDPAISPTNAPAVDPTIAPVLPTVNNNHNSTCEDDPSFLFKEKNGKNCQWVQKKASKVCGKKSSGKRVSKSCPRACGTCDEDNDNESPPNENCANDPSFLFRGKANRDCKWIQKKAKKNPAFCQKRSNGTKVRDSCPVACDACTLLNGIEIAVNNRNVFQLNHRALINLVCKTRSISKQYSSFIVRKINACNTVLVHSGGYRNI
mmetsp:Transcript_14747/g.41093  ORF Transcript_14747/g.41093 Transcript_14747/m.41093 type:complete len:781 (+) Transcript_14747:454-2796(+)